MPETAAPNALRSCFGEGYDNHENATGAEEDSTPASNPPIEPWLRAAAPHHSYEPADTKTKQEKR